VLTGEGADEFFGGYDIFREALARRFWAENPGSRFRFRMIEKLYPDIFKGERARTGMREFLQAGTCRRRHPFFFSPAALEHNEQNQIIFQRQCAGRTQRIQRSRRLRLAPAGRFRQA